MAWRTAALAFLVAGVLGATALPAAAHATLLSVDPQPGAVYDQSPAAVVLRFNEPVETALGGVRVFNGSGDRVDAGAPTHPSGRGDEVQASLPRLDDGTYVVTWRVISADSHPVEGAFTFQVGATATARNAGSLAARLLAKQGGSTVVGVVYAVARALLYAAIALLIGGVVFLAWVFPDGRGASGRTATRAARIVWIGWGTLVGATVAGIGLEGVYAAALPLSKIVDTTTIGDVLDTRYGRLALLRLVLLALALPLVRVVLHRRRLPAWWPVAAVLVGVGLAATPVFSGHASTGEHSSVALVSQTLHVLAMSCWLGGLVMMVALVLVRSLPDGLRTAVNRFSALGLGSVTVLVVTGGFQAWRQVGTLAALRDTDFGRLLLAKLVFVAAMVIAAAFSREVVNRHFRDFPDDDVFPPDDEADPARVPALVGASAAEVGLDHDERTDLAARGEPLPDEPTDEEESRVIRRSVMFEIVFAVVVLSITAMLVNTAPARTVSSKPVTLSMRNGTVFADGTIAPGTAGRSDIHLSVLSTAGAPVGDVQMQLTRPDGKLAPLDVPLRALGPGHLFAPQFDIPFPGDWTMVLRVRLGATDEKVLTQKFSLR
ncbi:MAG: copper resistance protein CopC [Acidimicrobiia bacterium]